MINSEPNDSCDINNNNNPLNTFDTSDRILHSTTISQSQLLALSSTQNINVAATNTLDKTYEITNIAYPPHYLFDWENNANGQGLSYSNIIY